MRKKDNPLKIIIDTNLWVSFVISKKLSMLDPLLLTGKARLLFSTELIDEIEITILKPKLRKFFETNGIDEMLTAFVPFIELIDVKSIVTKCRDPKDNFLLALAKDGKADILLTGDKDLLELKKFGKTKTKTISRFLEEMKIDNG